MSNLENITMYSLNHLEFLKNLNEKLVYESIQVGFCRTYGDDSWA